MTVYCFDNKIMAPLKCGTRYLRGLDLHQDHIHMTENDWGRAYETEWELMVLRTPISQLKSALKTEILNMMNGHDLWFGLSVEKILDRFIEENGCDHWSGNMYKKIYELWISQNMNPRIIHLNDLSYFLSMRGINLPFIKEKYDFSNFKISKSRDEIFEMVKNDYPAHFKKLMELTDNDSSYYARLKFEEIKKKLI